MVEGVQVLQTIYEKSPIIILWIFCIIGSIGVAVCYFVDNDKTNMGICWLAVAAVFGFFIWWPVTCPTNVEYKVILNPGTSYSDFVKEYDVLDTEGAILTVTKRETVVFRER